MSVTKFHRRFQGMLGHSPECKTQKTAEAEKTPLGPRGEKKCPLEKKIGRLEFFCHRLVGGGKHRMGKNVG